MGTQVKQTQGMRCALLCSSALVFACMLQSAPALAEPQGGLVVGGAAIIETVGPATNINQSTDRAVIRWDSFDVGSGEQVNFLQPSASSITVNRIRDNKASQIDGQITANGNIVLMNQNGILFGSTARVDVGGLVATTSDLENDGEFMAGGAVRFTKSGNPNAQIINHGNITVGEAGFAGLVAPHVENHGLIQARLGKIALASGDVSTIDFAGDGLIQIEVSDAVIKQTIRNNGMVRAEGGQVLITAAAGRNLVENLIVNEGVIAANTVAGQKGRIRIDGNKSTIQNTGVIEARGNVNNDGGKIDINGAFVSLGGIINADGKNGGDISIAAGTLSLADKISANGLNGNGGTIDISSQQTWETSGSELNAIGTSAGGYIRHIAEQQIISSGNYDASSTNGNGGNIDISAWSTKFLSAKIDASGETGGGTIRLGGEYQGGKDLPTDEIPNAYYLVMDRGTRVRAEAKGANGKGGTAILWSDQETVALGSINVMPGTQTGEGGFVEISSGETPKFDATVETGRGGRNGTVLLDPKNILISDFSFNSTAIIMGYGYQGGRTNQNTNIDANDYFGYAVSLDGNRMAVGAYNDDAFNNTMINTGAVYLFSYSDSNFSDGTLEAIIGSGYTGGKNIDLSATLANNDFFGYSVSLDGNRLAVGAYGDDGSANSVGDSGAVYLFSFADSVFTGGALESTIGRNYTGGKNVNITTLDGSDVFGSSVSLDGNRLAVGSILGDGFGNTKSDSGAVFLLNFSDSAFNGGALQATIGNNFTGGKNINVTLDNSDWFGRAVSLDGNQLIVGAERDDGVGNTLTDAGAAYLFNFSDAAFTGGTLQSTIGFGYTGGKNINISELEASDYFGSSVTINSNRFAVGAYYDDGRSNAAGNVGGVYLFSHDNNAFDNIVRQGKIGYQYNDPATKDKDLWGLGLGGSDTFGSAVSLDGNRLIIGAAFDDGVTNAASNAGAVYNLTFANSLFSTATLEGITGSGYLSGKNFNVPTLTDTDNNLGISVALDGRKLAIGNYLDDGFNGQRLSSGAVYLYSFTDDTYSNGVLEAIIGDGYTGGKNFNQSLDVSDQYGISLSMDGNRLAVGSQRDDGLLNNCGDCGSVYLYSFADSVYNGITLSSRIGFGYNGAKDINTTGIVGGSDLFGSGVSLDGTRLAVGAYLDDGLGNVLNDSGSVYLFTFADTAFNGGVLQGNIGRGYTGGKNINVTNLDASDQFGISLSLDGNRLAVGAYADDGFGNTKSNSGAVYLYSFTDSVFSGGVQEAIIGDAYTGGKNVTKTNDANDFFGAAVTLTGNNLFIGAYGDDGFANAVGDSGAVFRYSFSNSTFSGGALASSIGARYIGASDYDVRGYVAGSDQFGRSISVDGQNMVVGAFTDDGYANNATDAGSIYLFRYTDTTYSTPNLQGVLGAGYDLSILDKGVSTLNAKENDFYGNAVSIDGNRMVVGAPRDDGFNDVGTDRGAVYLYSFTDSIYGGGILEGIIGQGYTGGKNINIALANSDNFGSSVSLDGNRLAIGAYLDDGASNTNADAGAVYLYTFTDSVFSGGALQGIVGRGYNGGKNVNITALENSDYFGWSVSLNGNRLAVGAQRDDGSANARSDSGAVYLINFSDSVFTGGALQSTIGHNYTGGKNINTALDTSDYFGSAVSLDGNMLVVGAPLDDGNANALTDSGAAYYYTFSDSVFTGGALQGRAGFNYTGGKNINVTTLETLDWFGASLSLDANRLAVGIEQDDGFNNEAADSGAVSLYHFSDSVFTGGTYDGTIGYQYSGGKNLNLKNNFISDVNDRFSFAALDGNRLIIGGSRDDPGGHLTDAGSVAMITFADASFNSATLVGVSGNGYIGGRNTSFNSNLYDTPDSFGTSVSLNGNRIAVGVQNDDGFNNPLTGSGAVYLYSVPGGDYNSILLEGILGYGYTGGKNVDLSSYLDRGDFFGNAVSLNGNRLAVGAWRDDGRMNNVTDAGAVYLFNFSDSAFTGGALQARIGSGYSGGKNINVTNMGVSDYFGYSVSLDGNRLAVGAQRDDGFANNRTDAGAIYLYSFSDAAFTGGTLQGTLGYGYTGGKNLDLSSLNNSDYFGNGVSLNGNRIAITAPLDDGVADTVSNAGAAYLFTFADSVFTTPTLQGIIGSGYTGGKNYNFTPLVANDQFGASVALDGTILAIGSTQDQGFNLNTGGAQGAIFIYSFADTDFSTPFYDSAIGHLYTGGKNIPISLSGSFGSAISLNSGTLIAGVPGQADVTASLANTGRVYIYRDGLSPISAGATYAINGGSTVGITASSIAGLLSTGTNVTLQASNDITLSSLLLVNNGTGDGGTLTLQAGRSIILNANIETDNGDLNVLANEKNVTGVVSTQRDVGAATISMGAGTSINAGTGSVVFRINDGAGNTNFLAGNIVLNNITANDFMALSGTQTGNIISNGVITANGTNDAIILDSGANYVNNYGAGALVTPSGRWLVFGDHDDYTTLNGLTPNFSIYDCTYLGACSGVIAPTGNGVMYEYDINLLTVTINTSRLYGDANPNLATLQSLFQYTGFDGADNASVLDVLPTATIAGTATATANAGTTHAITLSGGSDNYYDYYFVDGLLTINKKDITAVWNGTLSKIYGDINPTVNTTNFTYTGLANSETNGVITAGANFGAIGVTTGAGSYSIGSTFSATNYNVTNSPTKTLTINKRDITAAWTGGLSKTYGDSNPTVNTSNFTYTGFVNSDTNAAITASGNFGIVDATSNVGSYSVGGAYTSANYNVTNTPITTLTINKRDITAAVNNASRAYGDANPALTGTDVTFTNMANSENGSVIDALTLAAPTAISTSNAGTTHTINLTGFSDNNYNLTGNTAGTLTINKRDITAVVNSTSRAYGDANPAFTWSDVVWSNLANGQDGSVLDSLTVAAPTAISTSNAGTTHTINLSGFSDNNYNLTGNTAGTLTINKRDITANIGAHSQTYGESTPQLSWSDVIFGNLTNGDTGAVLDSITFTSPTLLSTSGSGTSHVTTIGTFSDNNYQLLSTVDGTQTITQAPLSLTVLNSTKTEGDANPLFLYTLSGLKNAETDSVLSGVILSTLADTSSPAGIYAINAVGGTAVNYFVSTFIPGALTIDARPVVNQLPNTYITTLLSPSPQVFETQYQGVNEYRGNSSATGNVFGEDRNTDSNDNTEIVIISDASINEVGNDGKPILIAITESIRKLFNL